MLKLILFAISTTSMPEPTNFTFAGIHATKLTVATAKPNITPINPTVASAKSTVPFINPVATSADSFNEKTAELLTATIENNNTQPSDCLVISDSLSILQAAKHLGIACLGYEPPNQETEHLYGIEYIVQDLSTVDADFLTKVHKRFHHEPLTILETERLVLRELSLSDIPALHHICSLPSVREFLLDYETTPATNPNASTLKMEDTLSIELEKHKAYIKNVYEFYDYGYWGVFEKSSNTLIGRCGIQNNTIDGTSEIELGYLLDTAFVGHGYARECAKAVLNYAFQEFQFARIVALIDVKNTRSLAVAKALGMHYEKELLVQNRTCALYVCNNKAVTHS